MSKVKMVEEKVGYFSGYELEGQVQDIIGMLTTVIANHGTRVRIAYEQQEYDDGYEFNLYVPRPENEVERVKRLEKEKKEKDQRDKWDREQYEKLKRKFGDKE